MGFLREPSHLIIIAVVILVLFGGKKLPEAARGLGRSMRIFKSEVKQMHDDDEKPTAASQPIKPTSPVEGRVVDEVPPRRATSADVSSGEPRDTPRP